MSKYRNPALTKLKDQQVRFAPHEVRLAQMERAENFLAELNPSESYSYPEICEQITNHKTEMYPQLVVEGKDALHDLRLFVEDLSDSLDIDVDSVPERVLTVQEIADRYNVSTKTVNRWRERGLVSRRFLFGKRKRVGFLQSSVARFIKKHRDDVTRGKNFSQISDDERMEIVRKARRMAKSGGCPIEISRRLARKMHRSVEAIRYTLKNYDQQYPENAVFPNSSNPMTEETKREIFHRFRRRIPVDQLAQEYCRDRSSIYRIVAEVRSERIFETKLDFMDNEEFYEKGAEKTILGPPPEVDKPKAAIKVPPGLPPYLASLYETPLLTREEEGYYFRKMNFLKFQAETRREKLNPARPSSVQMERIEALIDQAVEVKNFLIRSNLRLVVSIAKKHMNANANFFEMVSDGNMSLIRAIEKFDYSRGNKFSTYASWAIMKNYARSIPKEHKVLDRFRTGLDDAFNSSSEQRANPFLEEMNNQRQKDAIFGILDCLDERERRIIVHRFGLDHSEEPRTLEQVGQMLGVTKERIRQLEGRAIKKLKQVAVKEKLDVPGI